MVRRISQVLALSLAFVGVAKAEFSYCKFNFGVDWTQHVHKNCADYRPNCNSRSKVGIPAGVDFIGSFIGWTQDGATKVTPDPRDEKEGMMLSDAKALAATPVWYSYIIAEGAKTKLGVTDCNVGGGSGTLCTKGAKYIRDNRAAILSQYQAYASFAASNWGTSAKIIWALEPDFHQYAAGNQEGGALSTSEAKTLLSDIITAVKGQLPNALISMDISPWVDQGSWIPAAIPVDKIDFMNTSGGVSSPSGTIKDITSWSQVWGLTKKGMIADDGYGTGGVLTNPNAGWSDVNNLKARISDGVVGLMEAFPGSSWSTTISGLRSQLPELKTCNGQSSKTTFSLTLTAGNGGAITSNPTGDRFDSGTTVQLTAVPQTGYQFDSWSGDVTGTSTSASITVKKNSTVTATFKVIPATKFTLTVLPTEGGSITLEPNQTSYDSGALVKVTAVPANGYTFTIWKDAVVTKINPNQILMNKNKSIGATFTSNTGVQPRKNVTALRVIQSREGVSVRIPVKEGSLRAEVVGMDGATEIVLQNTTVQSGSFEASYSLAGLRPGLHVVRVVNGEREFRAVVTQVVR